MKSFIILILLSLAVAGSSTPAGLATVNHGRRLSSAPAYLKLTCMANVSGVMPGDCSYGSNVDYNTVYKVGLCFNLNDGYATASYTGTTITLTQHQKADCSDTGTPVTYTSGVCKDSDHYYKIYEGTVIKYEAGEKCSSVTNKLGDNNYVADNKCLVTDTFESVKGVCSSDGKVSFFDYSEDATCSKLIHNGTQDSGECVANPAHVASPTASPAARAVPFAFVLLSVILASTLLQ